MHLGPRIQRPRPELVSLAVERNRLRSAMIHIIPHDEPPHARSKQESRRRLVRQQRLLYSLMMLRRQTETAHAVLPLCHPCTRPPRIAYNITCRTQPFAISLAVSEIRAIGRKTLPIFQRYTRLTSLDWSEHLHCFSSIARMNRKKGARNSNAKPGDAMALRTFCLLGHVWLTTPDSRIATSVKPDGKKVVPNRPTALQVSMSGATGILQSELSSNKTNQTRRAYYLFSICLSLSFQP